MTRSRSLGAICHALWQVVGILTLFSVSNVRGCLPDDAAQP
jgi:hypothetical protein